MIVTGALAEPSAMSPSGEALARSAGSMSRVAVSLSRLQPPKSRARGKRSRSGSAGEMTSCERPRWSLSS